MQIAVVQLHRKYIYEAIIGTTIEDVQKRIVQLFQENDIPTIEGASFDEIYFNDAVDPSDVTVIFCNRVAISEGVVL